MAVDFPIIIISLLICWFLFLKFAYSRTDVFQKLYKALPIGGVDGTLKYRMQRGTPSHKNVHAKTGSFTAINLLGRLFACRKRA